MGLTAFFMNPKERIRPRANRECDNAVLGWHGGISMEYGLGPNLALIAELHGRYMKAKDLRGRMEYATNRGGGLAFTSAGSLHFFELASSYFDLDILLPAHYDLYFHVGTEYIERKAVLDLSGVSIRFGLRVWVF